jgi:hypothetical protein
MLKHGALPKGKSILHSCDNPPCVRWKHLFPGTAKDNAVDRNAKGRMRYQEGGDHWTQRSPEKVARGKRSGRHTHPERTARGERHGMARLRTQDVLRIRKLYSTAAYSYRALARMFDVSESTIGMLMTGHNWAFSSNSERQTIEMVRHKRLGMNQFTGK